MACRDDKWPKLSLAAKQKQRLFSVAESVVQILLQKTIVRVWENSIFEILKLNKMWITSQYSYRIIHLPYKNNWNMTICFSSAAKMFFKDATGYLRFWNA